MAGYIKIYCIGELGGFQGADGINPVWLQIWEGTADRMWFEAKYFKEGLRSLCNIKTMVPERPDDPNMLLDACICFFPEYFNKCPSLIKVERKLGNMDFLDFNLDKKNIPMIEWEQLRIEAKPLFKKLHIFEAELKEINK